MAKGGGFPGMGGMNMQQMMKQAQKMQQDMARTQEELGAREYTAQAGGVVKATVYGRKELKGIEIDPACVDPDDVEMLQDLITAAVNEALRMAEADMSEEMGRLTGGMNLGF